MTHKFLTHLNINIRYCLGSVSSYIFNERAEYLQERNMYHVRGRPLHPKTQGKIERYYRSMKNVVKLDNYFSPGQLEAKLDEFVKYYNHQ